MSSINTDSMASTNPAVPPSTSVNGTDGQPNSLTKAVPHRRSIEERAAFRDQIAAASAKNTKPPSKVQERLAQNYAKQKASRFRPSITKSNNLPAVGSKNNKQGGDKSKLSGDNKKKVGDINKKVGDSNKKVGNNNKKFGDNNKQGGNKNDQSGDKTKQTVLVDEKPIRQVPEGREAATKMWTDTRNALAERSEYIKSTQGYAEQCASMAEDEGARKEAGGGAEVEPRYITTYSKTTIEEVAGKSGGRRKVTEVVKY
ncbi:hypothetical protein CLAFUW4_07250 [Fulvia fulva]|uniref:Uncharacterized protein n=1 Tax=Passalora fulva TaxID=5499 RepID=A0A9Q8PBD4_PASFU|nr:uncharacterized protein CLAFUR5_07381 [Fulvia fulva]KAK4621417.1 hypothetical protein CLAFUR4_07258 [Fulvia fulva]KAK4622805.1 hypothetical protein CLAFUR0_07255 [Fulvia fulva]UJO19320.1 hypothetical protein CLAFUR5_07381 [Fulvia fulva]WPV16682.1 hypothetical protein CLAFUW4_07250 [Fulvia fulva]WPV31248.1 hypothetical protein CLAFUW7_07251 [Fulvia fulva]